ncbi:hypothetical protein D9M68_987360 [compost metagenome]
MHQADRTVLRIYLGKQRKTAEPGCDPALFEVRQRHEPGSAIAAIHIGIEAMFEGMADCHVLMIPLDREEPWPVQPLQRANRLRSAVHQIAD